MTMIPEMGASVSVLTPGNIATRTGATDNRETDGYRFGVELASRHPEIDPESLAEMLSLSAGADADIRSTIADVHRAVRQGWTDLTYESSTFRGLNKLVAWIFSAGYVTRGYTPYFEIRHGADYERLDRAFDRLQCGYEPDGVGAYPPWRARPKEAATALGRVLVTLGAPLGPPTERTTLPGYLDECPEPVRNEFAYTYLNNRTQYPGAERPNCERQSPTFRREIGTVLTTASVRR